MQVNFKINQNDLMKLSKKLDNMRAFESKKVSNELGKTALEIVRLAKRAAPVDKGALRQSISSQRSGKSVNVIAAAKYAPYVEFGTGRFVSLDDMKELGIPDSYAAQFKGKGIKEVNLPARPFFFSSARIGLNNLYKRLNDEIKKTTK